MEDVYIENLNEAKKLSDTDFLMIHTDTEDLRISIGLLKTLLTVVTASKLSEEFDIALSGDATGAGRTDGSKTAEIEVSEVKATRLKEEININNTAFDGSGNITTEKWGKERIVTIGGCERSVDGSGNITFPAIEVFSGSGQPYVPTAGGTMTGDLKRNINNLDYSVYSAIVETEQNDKSVRMKYGDVNANMTLLSLSQPYWNNGVNLKKILTEDDIFELERRVSELESVSTQTLTIAKGDNTDA